MAKQSGYVLSKEEKNDSFIVLELFDPFVFSAILRVAGHPFVVVVYKGDLEGHKGTRKLLEKLGDNYLLELLSLILIHNSQLYFTCLYCICIFAMAPYS